MTWIFHESDPMGGAAGEAYANTLKSPGMQPEHVLAREAIQNSVDACLEDAKVLVRFRRRIMTGAAKSNFVAAAGLEEIAARAEHLELSGRNCLGSLNKPRVGLSLLYVEDHDAEGLSGDPHDKSSNFYRLLLSLGDRSKARTTRGSGGSYGFGKSVYSSSSAIQTIVAYTRFLDTKREERTRIFGCGYYASHEHANKSFSGRAWFGSKKRADAAGRVVVDPLENAAADDLAVRLGFERRDKGDLGTTILVIDAVVDLPSIVAGVEDWWWPRLIEHKLDVEIIDADGSVAVPRPKKNEQLRPFIEAFEIARGIATPKSGTQKLNQLNRLGQINLGGCGFVVAPLGEQGTPIIRPDRSNTVALVRSPLMVVAYKAFSESAPIVAGAFMAADDIDLILKRSEPPAHDRWDPDSVNLRDGDVVDKEVVNAVISRIKSGLRRFQSEAAPPAPPRQKRLSALERALGSYFRPNGVGRTQPPEPTSSLVHLEFTKSPRPEATTDGRLRLTSAFIVTLDPKAEDDSVNLHLRVSCPVLEDEGQEGDELDVTIDVRDVQATRDPDDTHLLRIKMLKGTTARVSVVSEPYDPSWTVRFRPELSDEAIA